MAGKSQLDKGGKSLEEVAAALARTSDTAKPDAIDAATLASIDVMSREDLIEIIKRIAAARWGLVALLNDNEAYESIRLKLLQEGLNEPSIVKALPALKEWIDRTKGKPLQTVASTVVAVSVSLDDRRRSVQAEADMIMNAYAIRAPKN